MLSRKQDVALSIAFSMMFSASLLASAPLGPIVAAAGPQIAPAVLTQALETVRRTGWSTGSESAPTPIASIVSAPTPSRPALSQTELKKINALDDSSGADIPLLQSVTQLLGLTQPGQTLTARQLTASDDNDTVHFHFFNRSTTDANVIILMFQDKSTNTIRGYRTDLQSRYISGYISVNGGMNLLTPQEAAAGFAAEIQWWAQAADSISN
jgi:hypothetical protein